MKEGGVLIETKRLALGYGEQAVLKDLNLTIREGDFICIVGQNGAGKTTLVRGMLGLMKPLKGEVIYRGVKRDEIGFMPQETLVDAHFPATVFEIVLSGTLNRAGRGLVYRREEKERAKRNLERLGILGLKDRSFTDLSGGQRQKVLLARSLTATTKMLILDEPSNNLDHESKEELYRNVERLNREDGITILMITHDLDHGNLIGNKILSLAKDEVFFGTTAEFVRRVHHG